MTFYRYYVYDLKPALIDPLIREFVATVFINLKILTFNQAKL